MEEGVKVVTATWKEDKPGLKGGEIIISFNTPTFKLNDHISYDWRNGTQLRVIKFHGSTVTCKIICVYDDRTWMEESYLEPGTQYFKIGNSYEFSK